MLFNHIIGRHHIHIYTDAKVDDITDCSRNKTYCMCAIEHCDYTQSAELKRDLNIFSLPRTAST